jgi:hypothetical protein
MHEIPNFPFPSLHQPAQTTKAQQEPGENAALKAKTPAQDSHKANSKD